MSLDEVDCCRLCLSQKNLISMFSGKSRIIRDFLRKMIEETVQIKIEQYDSGPSVCFNCSVDVSNFYFFKLNCLQNRDKLMGVHSSPKSKRHKLQSLHLTDIPCPDIKATETVLSWLSTKREKISEMSGDNETQSSQIHSRYEKSSQTDSALVNHLSRTDILQPDLIKKYRIDCTKKLKKKLFQNNIVSKVYSKARSTQTKVFNQHNKHIQCNILKVNDSKNCTISQTTTKVISRDSRNNYKIADPHAFTDALLNGFDNIFVSKETQTEITTDNSDSYFSQNDSYPLSPSINSFSKENDSKLSIKIVFPEKLKEEEISPVESLTIASNQSPGDNGMLSPQSADLLQINCNKSDHVKICKLCDKTLYNRKEVVMHNKRHMQCNICKKKFRSIKAAQLHINDCKNIP